MRNFRQQTSCNCDTDIFSFECVPMPPTFFFFLKISLLRSPHFPINFTIHIQKTYLKLWNIQKMYLFAIFLRFYSPQCLTTMKNVHWRPQKLLIRFFFVTSSFQHFFYTTNQIKRNFRKSPTIPFNLISILAPKMPVLLPKKTIAVGKMKLKLWLL